MHLIRCFTYCVLTKQRRGRIKKAASMVCPIIEGDFKKRTIKLFLLKMKKTSLFILSFSLIFLLSCRKATDRATTQEASAYQQSLLEQGWEYSKLSGCELSEEYGYTPEYGMRDNYFEIKLGGESDCLVKIIDCQTNKCIREALVTNGSSVIISQIPQKRIYLKLAFGRTLMEKRSDYVTECKFTSDVSYEKSATVFDFGTKNSPDVINYTLEINISKGTAKKNFETIPISEEEFMK